MEKLYEKKYFKIRLSQFILFLLLFMVIISGVCYFFINNETENNKKATELEKNISTLCLKYEAELAELNKQIKDYETEYSELKEKNNELEEYKKENPTNINAFCTGYYSNKRDILLANGMDEEWGEPIVSGFDFKEDGSVLATIPGDELGYLKGTYEVSNNEINCTFTVYENKFGGSSNSSLLNEKNELTLKQINEQQLQIKSWNYKLEKEYLNELIDEGTVFTYNSI